MASTVWAMNAKPCEQILAALQNVVGMALKNWLNENKAEVLEALRAAHPARQDPPQAGTAPAERNEPKFLGTAEVAVRWQLHRESVRRMVRQGRLPRVSVVLQNLSLLTKPLHLPL